jgi:Uma2 family endonuclease
MALRSYAVDPADPRAPSAEVWEALTPAQRRQVVDSLPSEPQRASPPEGDLHRTSKNRALEALDEYFRRIGRRIYLSSELPVYYPDAPMFAPDLLAVADVEPHERARWVVSDEGRGLDLVLEIHVAGDANKDFRDNVQRYAQLKIPEYFAFDVGAGRLAGWRLGEPGRYSPIVGQHGRWSSGVLGLDLAIEDGRLRFYHGTAELLDGRELIARLSRMVDGAVERAEAQARRAEEEARRAERLAARLRDLGIDPDAG